MKNAKTFPRGGVHPPDSKLASREQGIRNAPIPAEALIPLHQHMGTPAECLVQPGDELSEGMLIGRAAGPFSASVHSSVPGKVKEIREIYLPNGIRSRSVVVSVEGKFGLPAGQPAAWQQMSKEQLLAHIREMGIVGLGGATFPTPLKYSIREGRKVSSFVVNGVECEPFLTADHRLMLEKSKEILTGIRIVARILEPEQVLIGIEDNKPDAVAALSAAVKETGLNYQVVPLQLKYPQGDEKQLLKALTGLEVPSGGLPLDIGAVVSNVGTVYAIYEAFEMNKPLIERIVTVSGSALAQPANLKVRVGTPVKELIEDCGGFSAAPAKIISGGPMMGFALADLETPVTKGTSGILALSRKEVGAAAETNCLSCGRCLRACPLGLQPVNLYKTIDHRRYEDALALGLMDCKECGCCSFVCPAHIPLVQGMKLGKLMTRKKKA
jgi:electron transport complex protein RnfC